MCQDEPVSSENINQQIRLYGQPLSERFGAVVGAYGITQRRLAQVLGLSAPMLSQLISGRRIKIGNPAVYERLVMLEDSTGASDLEAVLTRVEASQPVLSTSQIRTGITKDTDAVSALAGVVPAGELERALVMLGDSTPVLSKVLAMAEECARRTGTTQD
ncbi:DNA-binding protein [Kocuria rhizophila]|uniref:DNA-binding protein n=1 Tax=Kocuria rhizophila TaxID=72000 RepID=A0AAX2SCD3_KOCRH|nr:DNA-binding protein [Kocuria rhizophila]PMR90936.1 DNA-binding protein [Kocuria rhizophila]RLP58528.1 DNA-binding protein [Kocuria rhizophila]TFH98894.1 DNA-binding protein [Kocuria rhizophila]TFI07705.1 DNA-binding protein [Kocuria rhizophila]